MHIPVLLDEVIKYLDPEPGENFVDCTFGGGGHTAAILKKNKPKGKVLGIELDPELYKKFSIFHPTGDHPKGGNFQFSNRLILVNDSFVNLKEIIGEYNFKPVDGVLLDLGVSSWHLEESGRGFTFRKDEPLIMRYAHNQNKKLKIKNKKQKRKNLKTPTAEQIINEWPEEELVKIFREYGEERFARRIARRIVQERAIKPIKTTFELVDIIRRATPAKYHYTRLHFATRTFQALRIAVNNELENLKKVLPQVIEVLARRGCLVIISFHSLEDRIVKNFLRDKAKEGQLKILTKKPITPSEEEIKLNPRSRSAKLRAAVKLA